VAHGASGMLAAKLPNSRLKLSRPDFGPGLKPLVMNQAAEGGTPADMLLRRFQRRKRCGSRAARLRHVGLGRAA
jgi:hypothetical protein